MSMHGGASAQYAKTLQSFLDGNASNSWTLGLKGEVSSNGRRGAQIPRFDFFSKVSLRIICMRRRAV